MTISLNKHEGYIPLAITSESAYGRTTDNTECDICIEGFFFNDDKTAITARLRNTYGNTKAPIPYCIVLFIKNS